MEITECPTALERDLNPPNTSQCPLLPHSLWDRPLYFSFSRKFCIASSSLLRCLCRCFHSPCAHGLHRVDLRLEVCMGGCSHLGGISGFIVTHPSWREPCSGRQLKWVLQKAASYVQPQTDHSALISARQTSIKACKLTSAVILQETSV